MKKTIIYTLFLTLLLCCNKSEDNYELKQNDIQICQPSDVKVSTPFDIQVQSQSDKDVYYKWYISDNETPISSDKNLTYTIDEAGEYQFTLRAQQNLTYFDYTISVKVGFNDVSPVPSGATAYITKVFEYLPAPGQFINTLPIYEDGDSQQDMDLKVLDAIGNNNKGLISLGGYGGYVIVGFDHTIANVKDKRDFRILSNAYCASSIYSTDNYSKGSCEPGIVMVSLDINKNGEPDDVWYEIAGSSHDLSFKEQWYDLLKDSGADMNVYYDFKITYQKPLSDSQSIKWEDNKGGNGEITKVATHQQSYYPQWISSSSLSFQGTRLMQNGLDQSGNGAFYQLYQFKYGYADNGINTSDDSCIDISWAINSKQQKIELPGVDFIKIYTGINQQNGILGECSTEISGITDLSLEN